MSTAADEPAARTPSDEGDSNETRDVFLTVVAEEMMGLVADDPWDTAPRIVLLPVLDPTPTDIEVFPQLTRLDDVTLTGRTCPRWEVPAGRYEKPWLALVGSDAPDWVEAVLFINESWAAPMNDGDWRAYLGGVRNRPDRDEIRSVTVTGRDGTTITVAQSRHGRVNPQMWSSGHAKDRGDRFVRRWFRIPVEPVGHPARVAHVVPRIAQFTNWYWDHTQAGNQPDPTVVADRLARTVAACLDADPDLTWETVRTEAVRVGRHGPAGLATIAAWFDEHGFAQHWIDQYGSINEAAATLVPVVGIDVARMVRWVIAVDGRAEPTERDMLARTVHGDTGLDLTRVTDPDYQPRSLLGVPISHTQTAAVLHHDIDREGISGFPIPDEHQRRARAQLARSLRDASGRDPYTTRRVPGDIAAIQARVLDEPVDAQRLDLHHATTRHYEPELVNTVYTHAWTAFLRRSTSAAVILEAVPYWLDSRTAVAVAGAHLPDDQFGDRLRLPHRSVFVCFETDLAFDDYTSVRLDVLADTPPDQLGLLPAFWYGWAGGWGTALGDLARHGGGLTGIILSSDTEGHLNDRVLWVLTAKTDPREPEPYRTHVLPGRIQDAHIGHVALNIAAYLCWGDFTPPNPLDLPDPTDRTWRKAIRSSPFRKNEPRGAALGVHLLRPPGTTTTSTSPRPGNRTVTGHLRRGHWRRSRISIIDPGTNRPVGPVTGPDAQYGVTYTYREHFIPPTAVAGGPSDDQLDVYRLPTPASLIEPAPTTNPDT